MMVEKKLKILNLQIQKFHEDYFKCKLLKKVKYNFCLNKFLTNYRVRKDHSRGNLNNLFGFGK